jgi:hypothetical protein
VRGLTLQSQTLENELSGGFRPPSSFGANMKIPAGTIKELPIGTFFRHDAGNIFIVVEPYMSKCVFKKDKNSYINKGSIYSTSFDDDIYLLEGEELENAKVELL